MNTKLSLLLLSSALFSSGAYAQSNAAGMSGPTAIPVPTVAPTPVPRFSSAAPATLKLGIGTIPNVGGFAGWLVKRVHTLSIDARMNQMSADGVASKDFVAVFSAEGALVYEYELEGKPIADFDQTGRNAGKQILPYRLQQNADGTRSIRVSAVSVKNMNALQNSTQAWRDGEAFKVIDSIDVATLTWDNRSTFANTTTLDIDFVRLGLKVGLLAGSHGSYLAIKGGGSVGIRFQKFTGGLAPMIVDEGRGYKYQSFNGSFNGGLEGNIESQNGFRVNVQSVYEGGGGNVKLTDTDMREKAIAQMDAHNNSGGSGDIPSGEAMEGRADFKRNYGYQRSAIDLSMPIGSGRPKRLGIGAQYNRAYSDVINSHEDKSIDMSVQYQQVYQAKIYLSF